MKTSGLRPEVFRGAAADLLAGHRKGYRSPWTGTKSFERRALHLVPVGGGWTVYDCPTRRSASSSWLLRLIPSGHRNDTAGFSVYNERSAHFRGCPWCGTGWRGGGPTQQLIRDGLLQ